MTNVLPTADPWPALRVADWADTRETLHMWTQIVGKVRLALAPMVNHWWQVAFYVSARGLTTSAIPGRRTFDMEFDFVDHQLRLRTTAGAVETVALEAKPVADFYRETMAALERAGVDVSILARPVEVEVAIPFAEDRTHTAYDPAHAHAFWGQLVQASRVLNEFRSRFIGKVSPVHFFWGGMDMAVTRFSGRTAPVHPGTTPNCPDWVMTEGYSHELSSAGFWPGGDGEGMFYAYAYPEPPGFSDHPVPAGAYSPEWQQFLLPYETVRTAADPDALLLGFLQSTYEAAALHGDWDRAALEDDPARRAGPR
ncbi:hypothetical protein DMB38_28700 [Streptomyces sp. WAC 06738]|uniref:DUF5996 family protein n=1 Tax=Streptomyces sp. WAC 06738 TaxID=2203210 RepID=UPI000F6EC0C5|nr:DUF5996 family protein [Streptomyces sp. WAC 06738]AZM49238.1 hypothetical protein DMB38_28700 [Streptomyces sp. WAC 06738]